jgi:hypothetical protein
VVQVVREQHLARDGVDVAVAELVAMWVAEEPRAHVLSWQPKQHAPFGMMVG